MANPIYITPNLMPDPDGCLPGTRQEMANFVASAITATFGSSSGGTSFGIIVAGSTTPTPEQQTALWFKTETSGQAIGWFFFFNGAWRRSGFPITGIFNYAGPSSVFDGTGKGLAGTQCEGFCLCNGQNTTPDLRDKFIVGASSYGTAPVIGTQAWLTTVQGVAQPSTVTGGAAWVRLLRENIPQLPIPLPVGKGEGGAQQRFHFGETTTANGNYSGTIPGTGDGTAGDDNLSPAAFHQNLPPYYAEAFIQFLPMA